MKPACFDYGTNNELSAWRAYLYAFVNSPSDLKLYKSNFFVVPKLLKYFAPYLTPNGKIISGTVINSEDLDRKDKLYLRRVSEALILAGAADGYQITKSGKNEIITFE